MNQTKKTYLSNAILSKATELNLAVIATPVISQENNMIGILLRTINFNNYDKFLPSLNLQNNSRLVLIEKNGAKLGDSENETSISTKSFEKKEQFSHLTSFNLALKGKSGSILEKFNGKENQITFLSYDIFQNKRILLLIQGCNSDGNDSNKCIKNNKQWRIFAINNRAIFSSTDSDVSWTTLDIPLPKNIFYNILPHLKIIKTIIVTSFVKNVVNKIT